MCESRREHFADRRLWPVLVTGVVVVIAGATALLIWRFAPHDPLAKLSRAAAQLQTRPLEARLSGFAYAPAPSIVRRVDPGERLRGAGVALDVLKDVGERHASADLHIAGLARIFQGDVDRALAYIEEAVRREPRNAAYWNDLGAVRHAVALSHDDPSLLADALGAERRALVERPSLPEAQFNEAVILDALGLRDAAVAAYERYVKADASSPWAGEATQRIARLNKPTRAEEWQRDRALLERAAGAADDRELRRIVGRYPQEVRAWYEAITLHDWADVFAKGNSHAADERLRAAAAVAAALVAVNGDTLLQDAVAAIRGAGEPCLGRLSRAHAQYYEARLLYKRRESARSLPMFRDAAREFAVCGSPMSHIARYYETQAVFDSGRTSDAQAMLNALMTALATSHHALRGQLFWLSGTIASRRGLLHEALASQQQALAIFRRQGEELNACAMSTAAAASLAVLGRRSEAWRLRVENFRRISRSGDPLELQTALDTAARTEALDDRWSVALPLLAASLELRLQQNPRIYASALIWYALAEQNLAMETSQQTIERAATAASALKDPDLRQRALADVTLVRGIAARRRDPRASLLHLDEYIEFAAAHDYTLFLPEARFERALAYRAVGDERAAESDLGQTLALLRDRATDRLEQRLTWFRTEDAALDELVDILFRRGDIPAAFEAIDDARAAPFGTGGARRAISAGVLVVEYVALRDRLLIFTRDAAGVRAVAVPLGEAVLRRASDDFAADIAADRPAKSVDVSRWLLAPIADSLAKGDEVMIVTDRAVANVPFAALRMPDGRYFIENSTFSLVPASTLIPDGAAVATRGVVAIGDPAVDPKVFDLPRLPRALREARALASLYRESTILTGAEATRENVAAAIVRAPVLHLATHAVAVSNEPAHSYLALAPSSASSGAFSLQEIGRTAMTGINVVVLTGCRTATTTHGAPAGSLALAFLAAGAPNVIGALWDVSDDDASEELAISFHRELQHGASPAAALRAAQLALVRSSDPLRNRPSAWSGFQRYARHRTEREGGKR